MPPREYSQPQVEVRNPFWNELPEGADGDVEEMWDCRIRMQPLSLATIPPVGEITPSLRNALRFLTLHPPEDGPENGPYLPTADASSRLTLVLDLDETLMHCEKTTDPKPDDTPDLVLHFTDSQTIGNVNFRPFAKEMLENIASWGGLCEVVVFTASTKAYADAVLNVLDPEKKLIQHRLYRTHCVEANGGYFKDLRTLGRNMDRTVLVDNSPVSLAMNPSNGIPIKSWLRNGSCTQLHHLLSLVKELVLSGAPVQPVLEERYNLPKFLESLWSTH
jgi:CTD small phosphatase-like protein 2